jgi:hypothetical protein
MFVTTMTLAGPRTAALAGFLTAADMLERLAALIPDAGDLAPLDPALTPSSSRLDCDERDAMIYVAAVSTMLLATRMGVPLPAMRPNCDSGQIALSTSGAELQVFHPSTRVLRMVDEACQASSLRTRVIGSCLVISL